MQLSLRLEYNALFIGRRGGGGRRRSSDTRTRFLPPLCDERLSSTTNAS